MTYLGHTDTGEPVGIDVRAVIEGRCVITANSGAGKSYLIRRAMEVTNGDVQQIIFDVEGDFVTLREKYDYLLVGNNGGDLFFQPERSDFTDKVRTFAQQLRELRASAIIDLSDLRFEERDAFIAFMLDALIEVPRKLWNPCFVVIDEAHLFAPQNGSTESLSVVKDLMTRGRKRGLGGILATQRLSELNKTVADTANKLIGRTGLDVDQKRAAGVLGLTTAKQREGLALLQPGTFWAYGPAFSAPAPRLITIDPVETRHPQLGDHAYDPPPAPEGVREILAALASTTPEPAGSQNAPSAEELKSELPRVRLVEKCDHEELIASQAHELEQLANQLFETQAERDEAQNAAANYQVMVSALDMSIRSFPLWISQRMQEMVDGALVDAQQWLTDPPDGSRSVFGGDVDPDDLPTEVRDGKTEAQGPDRTLRNQPQPLGRKSPAGRSRTGDRGDGRGANGSESKAGHRHAEVLSRPLGGTPGGLRPGGMGASESRAGGTPGGRNVSPAGLGGRSTEDMTDEEVEALIDRKLAARGVVKTVYAPAPEVVRKEYLGKAAERHLERLQPVSEDALLVYRYLMARGRTSIRQLAIIFDGADTNRKKWGGAMEELTAAGLVDNNAQGFAVAELARAAIANTLEPHGASDDEVDEVYQLALSRLVGAAD